MLGEMPRQPLCYRNTIQRVLGSTIPCMQTAAQKHALQIIDYRKSLIVGAQFARTRSNKNKSRTSRRCPKQNCTPMCPHRLLERRPVLDSSTCCATQGD